MGGIGVESTSEVAMESPIASRITPSSTLIQRRSFGIQSKVSLHVKPNPSEKYEKYQFKNLHQILSLLVIFAFPIDPSKSWPEERSKVDNGAKQGETLQPATVGGRWTSQSEWSGKEASTFDRCRSNLADISDFLMCNASRVSFGFDLQNEMISQIRTRIKPHVIKHQSLRDLT